MHNDWPECVQSEIQHSGLICNNTVQVRRLGFFGALPEGKFEEAQLKIAKWDEDFEVGLNTTEKLYNFTNEVNTTYFSVYNQQENKDAEYGWDIPFVTNHRYRFHFGDGLEFTDLRIENSAHKEITDLPIDLVTNFTETVTDVTIRNDEYIWTI